MIRHNITRLFPRAIEATETFLMKENKVVSEFDGYAAAIGASIRISGLIPTLAFYTDAKEKGDTERYKLLKAIAHVIPEIKEEIQTGSGQKRLLLTTVVNDVFKIDVANRPSTGRGQDERLGNMPNPDQARLRKWTSSILDASIALKLCMRNYTHTDDESDQPKTPES
ncbi:MAG: type III-B CRISPR module-associated protein Cmr5 [Bacteroidota bacterium]